MIVTYQNCRLSKSLIILGLILNLLADINRNLPPPVHKTAHTTQPMPISFVIIIIIVTGGTCVASRQLWIMYNWEMLNRTQYLNQTWWHIMNFMHSFHIMSFCIAIGIYILHIYGWNVNLNCVERKKWAGICCDGNVTTMKMLDWWRINNDNLSK